MTTGPNDEQTAAKFLRGLTIGALLGAVIAGSSIWGRRAAARRVAADALDAAEDAGAPGAQRTETAETAEAGAADRP